MVHFSQTTMVTMVTARQILVVNNTFELSGLRVNIRYNG